jgi:hypothetical protein
MKCSSTQPARSRFLLGAAAALLAASLGSGCGAGTDEDPTIYDIVVSVLSGTDLNSMHFTIYSYFNDGDFIGHGDDLECTVLVDATMTSKKYGDGSLEIWLQNEDSFAVPADVIRCAYRTPEELRDTSFAFELHDATNFTGAETNPTATISSITARP